jgi:peptide/nickel transport system permease protein
MTVAVETRTVTKEPKRHTLLADVFLRLVKEKPLGTIGGVVVLIFLLCGILADILAPFGFNESLEGFFLKPPSAQHILGTDNIGRDLLSRIIYGARVSMIVGLSAALISTVVSTLLGAFSGYFGGRFDMFFQRFIDAFMCFPGLILLISVMSLMGAGMWQVIIVLGILYGIGGSRIIRSAVIAIKENVYFDAAKAIGCSHWKTFVRHILPNVMAPIIILFTTSVGGMVLAEASLSFLGYGLPPPTPSWGGMLSGSARFYMLLAPWMVIWPGLALTIVVYGINMLGDALRDLLDPRLRGGVGRYGGIKVKKAMEKLIR